jgi:FtsP/CotA-like multicopper oxidase with cupredoxin domain
MNVRRVLVGAALAAGALGSQALPAAAQTGPYERETAEVRGTQFETRPTEGRPLEVQGVQATRGGLAVTGGDVVQLTFIGLGLVGAGAVLVRRSRRATPAPAEA